MIDVSQLQRKSYCRSLSCQSIVQAIQFIYMASKQSGTIYPLAEIKCDFLAIVQ
jgi:hypothetical protein